jgi:hypothetical protein
MFRLALVAFGVAITASGAMAQPTGLAVCDSLLAKLDACAEKLPEVLPDDFRTLNEKTRAILVDGLTQPGGKVAAEIICKQSSDGYRKGKLHAEYGCRF